MQSVPTINRVIIAYLVRIVSFNRQGLAMNKLLSTSTASQCARLLAYLQISSITTLQARSELDIMHPAQRVKELKDDGHNIVTCWTTGWTGKAAHRIASYVLLAGAGA